jgi:NAD(P)-dependent dehydrogenase (short-subunit alcohol dehydrogenase family)
MPGRLKGKIAIVTGGSNGMGAAESAMFAREGAKVVIMDMRTDLAQPVLERTRRRRGTLRAGRCDKRG